VETAVEHYGRSDPEGEPGREIELSFYIGGGPGLPAPLHPFLLLGTPMSIQGRCGSGSADRKPFRKAGLCKAVSAWPMVAASKGS